MSDASFLDGRESAIKLLARDEDDLGVISALCQDAIAERAQMNYDAKRREFSLLLKRFRWEDAKDAEAQKRAYERVQSVLVLRSCLSVQISGFDSNDATLIFDLIGLRAEKTGDNTNLYLSFAGDGELRITAEDIDVVLADVSKPYVAKSSAKPDHIISIDGE